MVPSLKQDLNSIWYNYYIDGNYSTVINQQNPTISNINQNLFLYQCTFNNLHDTCIKITSDQAKGLHSDCVFMNISSVTEGSIVYIEYSNIVQRRFIAQNCYSNIRAGASYINMNDQSTSESFTEESSIVQCGTIKVDNVLYNNNGKTRFSYINFSKNWYYEDGFYLSTHNFENISFSTIEENNVAQYSTFEVSYCNECSMIYCNVLRNHQNGVFGTISDSGTALNIYNTNFIGNYYGVLFYASSNATIKIYNSYIDTITTIGTVIVINPAYSMLNNSQLISINQPQNSNKTIYRTHSIHIYRHFMRMHRL